MLEANDISLAVSVRRSCLYREVFIGWQKCQTDKCSSYLQLVENRLEEVPGLPKFRAADVCMWPFEGAENMPAANVQFLRVQQSRGRPSSDYRSNIGKQHVEHEHDSILAIMFSC